jgi:hypothetical protein
MGAVATLDQVTQTQLYIMQETRIETVMDVTSI